MENIRLQLNAQPKVIDLYAGAGGLTLGADASAVLPETARLLGFTALMLTSAFLLFRRR